MDEKEHVRNLVALWTNQNTLVYSRLTMISAMQVAIFAGWFATYRDRLDRYSIAIAALGFLLAFVCFKLVDCDLRWKKHFTDRLREFDEDKTLKMKLLPPKDVGTTPGWLIMKGVPAGFCLLDLALAFLPLMDWCRPTSAG